MNTRLKYWLKVLIYYNSDMVNGPKEAVLYESLAAGNVKCGLCNHRCIIAKDAFGICKTRKNIDGKLYSLNYDKVCAANPDPIEKKPLFHFLPDSKSFSIAAPGCNFQCSFCQNWHISQIDGSFSGKSLSPEKITQLAIETGCKSIAYTYTEPTVFMEIASETAQVAKAKGLANVFVSNGFMTTEAVDLISDWLDAINIDIKAFTEKFYNNICHAKLQPVLDTIKYIAKNTNIWIEITTLIVPQQNDSSDEIKKIADFIADNIGLDTPWHISRFYPQYKYSNAEPTSEQTLQRVFDIAKSAGLNYVYIGNLPTQNAQNTYCPQCESLLIERQGFNVVANTIKDNCCLYCGQAIAGVQMNGC